MPDERSETDIALLRDLSTQQGGRFQTSFAALLAKAPLLLPTLVGANTEGGATQQVRGDLNIASGATKLFGAGECILAFLYNASDGGAALLGIDGQALGGGANNPGQVLATLGAAQWTGVKDSALKLNFYVFGGIITIQNNLAAAKNIDGWILRIR